MSETPAPANSAAKYYLVSIAVLAACGVLLCAEQLRATTIPVRHVEGVTHGFLIMRDTSGRAVAFGDMIQDTKHGRVSSRLTFHFKDGSLYDDTTIYSEHGAFRVLSDHLIEKGPSFKQPMETWVDATKSIFTARSFDKGKEKDVSQKLKIPRDLANGILYVVVKNIDPKATSTTVSMVVGTPKPRVVKVVISPVGEERFLVGDMNRTAIHYVMKIDIGGVAGVIAPVIGKQPANTDIWIASDGMPTFLKSQGPLYDQGPIWTIELILPSWPKKSDENSQQHPSTEKQ
ncbi:MAG TPA: hypothetical protein VKB26_03925 [Candidatus Acidoferrales bacterium]|nr:hypothetical protein [Candidatus Acidoferrales bacterium]